MNHALKKSYFLAALIFAAGVFAAEPARGQSGDYNGLKWNAYGTSNIQIVGYDGPGGFVVIPSTISNLNVTAISPEVFSLCTNLTSVIIPNTVVTIGGSAFLGCTHLASITIPNSVTSIGSEAFAQCSSLTSLTLPGSLTSIAGETFQNCTSLTSVTLQNGITSLGTYAFLGCSSLASINFPDSLTSIGSEVFLECTNLAGITLPHGLGSIGYAAFSECSSLTTVTVPASVTSMGDSVFQSCSSLRSVTLGSGLTIINHYVFENCTSLTGIILPDSVTSIGTSAFNGCTNLAGILIPNSVTSIGSETFGDCSRLASIILPGSISSIGAQAFDSCVKLTNVCFEGNAPTDGGHIFILTPLTKVNYISGTTGWKTTFSGVPTATCAECGIAGEGPPSLLTLANLSKNVYMDTGAGSGDYTILANNESLVPNSFFDFGFQANAYQSSDGSQIVIAFRGTVLSRENSLDFIETVQTLDADVSFIGNAPNPLLTLDTDDAAAFILAVKTQFPNANITLTGHSLGGALAQLCGEASGLSTVGFNAPGAADLFQPLLFASSNFATLSQYPASGNTNVNYRVYGDQVSLVDTPIGTAVTMPLPQGIAFIQQIDPVTMVLDNTSTFLYLHSIDTVIFQVAANLPPVLPPTGEPNQVQTILNAIQMHPLLATAYELTYGIQFTINDAVRSRLFDPAFGGDFVFTEDAGSPNFASVTLPPLAGVSSYELRYESGGAWSAFQPLQPGVTQNFSSGVNGFEFIPLNAGGSTVLESNFFFAASFTSTGSFSGTLVESSVIPGIPLLQSSVVSHQLNLVWNTNNAAGYALVTTTNLFPPVTWRAITNVPVAVSNQWVVKLPMALKGQFFRLSK